MDSHADASQAPTMKDIKEYTELMTNALRCDALPRVNCKFGKKWRALFNQRHKDFVGKKP